MPFGTFTKNQVPLGVGHSVTEVVNSEETVNVEVVSTVICVMQSEPVN